MKKLLLLSALLIFACSSDDSNNNTSGTTDNSFNPPNWIQGVWLDEDFPIEFGYEFRPDNICIINSSQATCYKYYIDLYQDTPNITTEVYEISSDSTYYVVFTYAGAEQTFEFEKISPNSINQIQGILQTGIYTKQ